MLAHLAVARRFMSAQEVQSQWARDLASGGPQQDDIAAMAVPNDPASAEPEPGSRRGGANGSGHDDIGTAAATGAADDSPGTLVFTAL